MKDALITHGAPRGHTHEGREPAVYRPQAAPLPRFLGQGMDRASCQDVKDLTDSDGEAGS